MVFQKDKTRNEIWIVGWLGFGIDCNVWFRSITCRSQSSLMDSVASVVHNWSKYVYFCWKTLCLSSLYFSNRKIVVVWSFGQCIHDLSFFSTSGTTNLQLKKKQCYISLSDLRSTWISRILYDFGGQKSDLFSIFNFLHRITLKTKSARRGST